MTRISIEKLINNQVNYLSENNYDHTKWNLGKGMVYNHGILDKDKYINTQFHAIRPMETSTPFAVVYVSVVNFSPTIDYVFGLENSTAASAARRIALWSVNKKTNEVSWNGFITMTYATATAHTARSFQIDRKQYSTGTISVSGTAVSGTSTQFVSAKVAVGARIGFGSTDPKQITNWYRITARGSETSLTINSSAGTIPAGTPYIIEEYRPIILNTNATTTNGGIHYGKGISIEDFTTTGTTIPVGTTIDDIKAMYWIKDASTQTNIVGAGMAVDFSSATDTSLMVYVCDLVSAGNYKFYVYDIRKALTISGGATTSAWILSTGNNPFAGAGTQNSNMDIATTSHGTGNGIKSLYLVSSTRVYRVPLSQITAGSTAVFSSPSDNITEIPPGGSGTFAITGALSTILYMKDIDSFIIGTTSSGGNVSYITQYVSPGQQFQKTIGRDYRYYEQSTKDNQHPTIFSNSSTTLSFDASNETNLTYVIKQGTGSQTNQIYIMALGADWEYSKSRLITPEIITPNALKYYRVIVNNIQYLGGLSLGKPTEAIRLYARTTNITNDDTSGWILLDETNNISGFAGASSIQFAIEFKTIGESCLPNRVLGVSLSYEDNTSDSHYAISVAKSSLIDKRFAFWFKTAWGHPVPPLTIRLYNADTGGLLLTDTTTSQSMGVFEKTIDGINWGAYDTNDRTNSNTWIRYTPTSLADNIKVQAYITQ